MASVYNGVIDQGADWYINFTYEQPDGSPVNLTGYTAKLQLRTSPLAKTAVMTLSTDTGDGIVITGSTGLIACHATATKTAAINPAKYAYDLELYNSGIVTRLIQGTMEVSANTTR